MSGIGCVGRTWREAWTLAVFVMAVQAAFLFDTATSAVFRYPIIDAGVYFQQANAMLHGAQTAGAFWQPPAYPWFLSVLGSLVGMHVLALRVTQALILAPLAALLLWRMARRFLPPAWALATGIVLGLTGPFVFYSSQLLPAVPAAVLLTAAVWLTLRALEQPSIGRWFAVGVVIGIAALFVPTCGALLPVVVVCGWRAGRLCARLRRFAFAIAPLAALLLTLTPVAVRNYDACGHWIWISTNGGTNLYVGNNRNWSVTLTAQPGLDWDKLMRLPYLQYGAKNAVEADRQFRDMAIQDARRDPAGCLKTFALKAAMFWHGREIPRNLDMYGWREHSALLRVLVWRIGGIHAPLGLLIPLAAIGVFALWRRPGARVLAASLIAFGLLVALYFPCSRYRIPVLPMLVLLACAGAHAGVVALKNRRWAMLAGGGLLALAVGVAVNLPVSWPTDAICYDAHLWNAIGANADVQHEVDFAKTCYEKALTRDPQFADAWFNLGTVFARQKDGAHAESCYRAAISARPDHDKARINLALQLAEQGKTNDALHQLTLAEGFNPLNADAFRNHAVLLLRGGHSQEAVGPLAHAAALDPSLRPELTALEQSLLSREKH